MLAPLVCAALCAGLYRGGMGQLGGALTSDVAACDDHRPSPSPTTTASPVRPERQPWLFSPLVNRVLFVCEGGNLRDFGEEGTECLAML